MKKYLYFIGFVFIIISFSCSDKNSGMVKNRLESDYLEKEHILKDFAGDFFKNVNEAQLSEEEKKYLKFLFAYMPLSDFADYDFNFYLDQVRSSIQARNTFPWAQEIPEDIFMQYVLPPRMNNENMDTARMIFFQELKERLIPMNLSMDEAALEVNHWCHEKVNYRPTDERTISPMGAVLSAFGRCGEESTFTTTALRAAGIPARQVYTPRWAHTDDNHAWVEVWINGKWYYMGACEPLPLLNMGWFDVPATRAMLVHTKQFGKIGHDDQNYISETDNFTWVNALDTYAPTKTIEVTVVDKNDKPVSDANVQFQLYNYAELYPLHSEKTDDQGKVKFKTGYGSLDIYADNGVNFVSHTVSPDQAGEIKITLSDENIYPASSISYEPPVAGNAQIIDAQMEEENKKRLEYEDSVRTAYEKTFYTTEMGTVLAAKYNYPDAIIDLLLKSRGNWAEIEDFLVSSANSGQQDMALRILNVISEKDLRDTRSDVLNEHMQYALKYQNENIPTDIFDNYVLNPRISSEMLKKYRKEINTGFSDSEIQEFAKDPEKITAYLMENIKTGITNKDNKLIPCNELNSYRVPLTPSGVHKLKLTDDRSFKIYYVAFCRSLGIPARIEQATGFVQVYNNGKWSDIIIGSTSGMEKIKRGRVRLNSAYDNRELKYRVHFSLARLDKADFKTVDLGWEIPISEFSEGVDLQTGEYMLLSAVRNEDGSINVNRKYFNLDEGETVNLNVYLPETKSDQTGIEDFVNSRVFEKDKEISTENLNMGHAYNVYCWIDPGKEPSKHIVRDLAPMINELKKNNVAVYIFVNERDFNPEKHGFSKDLNYYYDKDFDLLMKNSNSFAGNSGIIYPQIKMIDNKGKIVLSRQGYTIGIGETLLTKIL